MPIDYTTPLIGEAAQFGLGLIEQQRKFKREEEEIKLMRMQAASEIGLDPNSSFEHIALEKSRLAREAQSYTKEQRAFGREEIARAKETGKLQRRFVELLTAEKAVDPNDPLFKEELSPELQLIAGQIQAGGGTVPTAGIAKFDINLNNYTPSSVKKYTIAVQRGYYINHNKEHVKVDAITAAEQILEGRDSLEGGYQPKWKDVRAKENAAKELWNRIKPSLKTLEGATPAWKVSDWVAKHGTKKDQANIFDYMKIYEDKGVTQPVQDIQTSLILQARNVHDIISFARPSFEDENVDIPDSMVEYTDEQWMGLFDFVNENYPSSVKDWQSLKTTALGDRRAVATEYAKTVFNDVMTQVGSKNIAGSMLDAMLQQTLEKLNVPSTYFSVVRNEVEANLKGRFNIEKMGKASRLNEIMTNIQGLAKHTDEHIDTGWTDTDFTNDVWQEMFPLTLDPLTQDRSLQLSLNYTAPSGEPDFERISNKLFSGVIQHLRKSSVADELPQKGNDRLNKTDGARNFLELSYFEHLYFEGNLLDDEKYKKTKEGNNLRAAYADYLDVMNALDNGTDEDQMVANTIRVLGKLLWAGGDPHMINKMVKASFIKTQGDDFDMTGTGSSGN